MQPLASLINMAQRNTLFVMFWTFHEIQVLVINYYRSQMLHTNFIGFSNHTYSILLQNSKKSMCNFWLHSKTWLKGTLFWESFKLFQEIQTMAINFLRSQMLHTNSIAFSNHTHSVFSQNSKKSMCNLWLH